MDYKATYIRFGEIPTDEVSKIWCGEKCIGEEAGVSVYDAKIYDNGAVALCVPTPFIQDTLDTLYKLVLYDTCPTYLVAGDCVGKGHDGEPVIKNVQVIREIKIR